MSDMKSNDDAQAAMRDKGSNLSSGAQVVRSPWSTPGAHCPQPKPVPNVNTSPSNGNRK